MFRIFVRLRSFIIADVYWLSFNICENEYTIKWVNTWISLLRLIDKKLLLSKKIYLIMKVVQASHLEEIFSSNNRIWWIMYSAFFSYKSAPRSSISSSCILFSLSSCNRRMTSWSLFCFLIFFHKPQHDIFLRALNQQRLN